MERYKKSQKVKKRNFNRYKITIVISVVLIIALLTGFFLYNRKRSGGNTFSANISLPFYKDDPFVSNTKNIFYIKNNELFALNKKAKNNFNAKNISHGAKVAASETFVATFDETGYQLFDMKGKEESKKEGNVKIIALRVSDTHVAIQIEEQDKNIIFVYDSKGNEKYKTDVDANNLLDFGLSNTDTILWTLTANLNSEQPTSHYTGFNFTKNSVTNVINVTDQLVEKILLSNNYIFVIGTNNIITYTQVGKKEDSYLVYGWKLSDYKFSAARPTYVLVPRVDNTEKIKSVRIRQSDGNEHTFALQDECQDVLINGEKIFSFSSDKVFINDIKGNYVSSDNLPFSFKDIVPVFEHDFIIADNGSSFSLLSLK